jgi:hypothetical protein
MYHAGGNYSASLPKLKSSPDAEAFPRKLPIKERNDGHDLGIRLRSRAANEVDSRLEVSSVPAPVSDA